VLGLVLGLLQATDAYALPRPEAIPRAAYTYRTQLIREARFVWGLDARTSTFGAQVHVESGWNAKARNRSGATGLAQFMPRTALHMNRRYPELRKDSGPINPIWSLRALLRYNRENWGHLSKVRDYPCLRMRMTLASYNAGPGVHRYKRWPRETQHYVHRILQVLEPVYVANGWGLGSCS
jgi:soluble lytic murein transglycosylase-like protein